MAKPVNLAASFSSNSVSKYLVVAPLLSNLFPGGYYQVNILNEKLMFLKQYRGRDRFLESLTMFVLNYSFLLITLVIVLVPTFQKKDCDCLR